MYKRQALDRPDPAADAAGVKYTPGFVHNVIYETYLKDHEAQMCIRDSYTGITPKVVVKEQEYVMAGGPLFIDKNHP